MTEYDQFNNLCKAKGGHLAVPESQEKIQAIKSSILEHIRIFNYQSPKYLLGKFKAKTKIILIQQWFCNDVGLKRHGDLWRYENGKPLGQNMMWKLKYV